MAAHSYKDLLFTKHAYSRALERGISNEAVWQAVHYPKTKVVTNIATRSFKYSRDWQQRRVQVVAKYLANEKKYLVISLWVRGEEDKEPFVWWLLTLPFKLLWWLLKGLAHLVRRLILPSTQQF